MRRRPGKIDEIVLSIVRQSNGPIGAYRIVERSEQLGAKIDAPAVYRTLMRFVKAGKIERITSQKAFVASADEPMAHIICQFCGAYTVVPVESITQALNEHADARNFKVKVTYLEVVGTCGDCSECSLAKG